VNAADLDVELMASALEDGRREAHVAAASRPSAIWPTVNGPTAVVALDALEAELREVVCGTSEVTE
jgi:hypothetical protein